MVIKTGLRTILFVLLLVILCWIPRLVLVYQNDLLLEGQSLLQWKYLKVTTLFDLKTLAIWMSVYLLLLAVQWFVTNKWFSVLNRILGFLLMLGFLVYNFIAVFYYPTSKAIVGKEVFTIVGGQESSIIWSYVLEYWWAILSILLLVFLISVAINNIKLSMNTRYKLIYLVLIVPMWALIARGSLSLKPLNHLDAYAALEPNMATSAMTPAFILLESISQEPLQEQPYLSADELRNYNRKFYHNFSGDLQDKRNVCVLILESFGIEYTGMSQSKTPSYTPFLDSLVASNSVSFNNAFANGLRSMDAISSIYSGVPSMMNQPFIGSLYAHTETPSLLKMFKQMGYYSSFYHGADEESMGFKPYLISQGLDHYEGMQDYPNSEDYDGKWGIFDGPYLQYVAKQMDEMKTPFFTSVFTLSSHHPYTVPDEYSYLPKGNLDIHQSVSYTDASLRAFFNTIKNKQWYSNTLFVITADHSSINQEKRYQTRSGRYRIPLIFFSPFEDLGNEINTPAQHLDIGPTLLDIMSYPTSFYSLGKSLLRSYENPYVVHFEGGVYTLTTVDYSLEMSDGVAIGLYDEIGDPEHAYNLVQDEPKTVKELMHDLRAYIQNFNHRIISNTYH